MEKVCPWCGRLSDRGRLKNRTDLGPYPTECMCPSGGLSSPESATQMASGSTEPFLQHSLLYPTDTHADIRQRNEIFVPREVSYLRDP